MDITILEKDLDRRFRVIDIYSALLLNPDYSDVLDPDFVFYWDSDQINSGQRVYTVLKVGRAGGVKDNEFVLKQ
jgi:hypothetical protein